MDLWLRRLNGGVIVLAMALGVFCVACSRDRQEDAIGELFEADFAFTVDDFLRAAKEGRHDVVRLHLQAGMAVDAENQFGERALGLAAERAHRRVVEVLLDAGADPDIAGPGMRTPLLGAAEAGDAASVRDLIALGADATHKDILGWTPLRLAAYYGRDRVMAELLPLHPAKDLDAALLLAATQGHVGILDQLLAAGADVYQRTPEGQTALMLAAVRGHLGAVRVLLQRGANRFATDGEGKTAAALAEDAGEASVAEELDRLEKDEIAGAPLPVLGEAKVEHPGTVWRLDGAQLDGDLGAERPVEIGHYREVQLPVRMEKVTQEQREVAMEVLFDSHRQIWVGVGEQVPGLPFEVVRVNRRLVAAKGGGEQRLLESATLRDLRSGREFVMTPDDPGLSTFSHVDLIDAKGRTFRGGRGDHFVIRSGETRVPFRILELRPNEVLLERLDNGKVLALRTVVGNRRA